MKKKTKHAPPAWATGGGGSRALQQRLPPEPEPVEDEEDEEAIVCPACMRSHVPRDNFMGIVDLELPHSVKHFEAGEGGFGARTLEAAAEISVLMESKRPPFIAFGSEETRHILCPEVSPEGLAELESKSEGIEALLTFLKLCDQCTPFNGSAFKGPGHYLDIQSAGCACDDTACDEGAEQTVRLFPNGQISYDGGKTRQRSDVCAFFWKCIRKRVIASFLRNCEILSRYAKDPYALEVSVKKMKDRLLASNFGAAGGEARPPPDTPLRFRVGGEVICNCGEWLSGRIVKLWYREDHWPPEKYAPYQVQLNGHGMQRGNLIYVPEDNDNFCRAAPQGLDVVPQARTRPSVVKERAEVVLEEAPRLIEVGHIVRLVGLKGEPALNGQKGLVRVADDKEERRELAKKGREKVRLESGREVSVLPANMELLSPEVSPELDSAIRVALRDEPYILSKEELGKLLGKEKFKCSRCFARDRPKYACRSGASPELECLKCVIKTAAEQPTTALNGPSGAPGYVHACYSTAGEAEGALSEGRGTDLGDQFSRMELFDFDSV